LLISLKVIGAIAATIVVVFLATDSELSLHIGITVLVLLASGIYFFSKALSVRVQAFVFLPLTIGVSHGVDRYFWVGVWDRGYPWPYSHGCDCSPCAGFIGSITPFILKTSVTQPRLHDLAANGGLAAGRSRRECA
jgi:hypothetical protein